MDNETFSADVDQFIDDAFADQEEGAPVQKLPGEKNTDPYPEGRDPLTVMEMDTARYSNRLRRLLQNLSSRINEGDRGVPEQFMGSQDETAIPTEIIGEDTDLELDSGDIEFIGTGEELIYAIANEMKTQVAIQVGGYMVEEDTALIPVDAEEQRVFLLKGDIENLFEKIVNMRLGDVPEDKKEHIEAALNSIKEQICTNLAEVRPKDKEIYLETLKNAIRYVVDNIVRSSDIRKAITLQMTDR